MPLPTTVNAINTYIDKLKLKYNSVRKPDDRCFYINSNDGAFNVIDEPLVNELVVVNNTDDLTACKNYIQVTGYPTQNQVIDSTLGEIHTYNGTTWNVTTTGYISLIKPNRFYFNNILKIGYHSDPSNNVRKIKFPPSASTLSHVWVVKNTPLNVWQSVCYGNGLFVAIGGEVAYPQVMTSPDGNTWTARTAAAASTWRSVCYGNGLFVAVADSGTTRVMTSPDGITWTARTAAAANSWQSVCFAVGVFVAVSKDGTNRIMTSTNGTSWTARTAPEANEWYSVTFGNDIFVAVSQSGNNQIMTSTNATTWTIRSTPGNAEWFGSICFGNGRFVVVCWTGVVPVMTSTDGINWTTGEMPGSELPISPSPWTSVCYGNGMFVAVAQNGDIATSSDGITWRLKTAPFGMWESVTYGNGRFVAVASFGIAGGAAISF